MSRGLALVRMVRTWASAFRLARTLRSRDRATYILDRIVDDLLRTKVVMEGVRARLANVVGVVCVRAAGLTDSVEGGSPGQLARLGGGARRCVLQSEVSLVAGLPVLSLALPSPARGRDGKEGKRETALAPPAWRHRRRF